MVRKDGAEARKQRITKISRRVHAALENNNGEIPLTKTIAILAIETGLTKKRIIEYLTLLADVGHFLLDFDRDRITKMSES